MGKGTPLSQELLIEALEQIHFTLQAELELELQKYRILMEMNAAPAVKI